MDDQPKTLRWYCDVCEGNEDNVLPGVIPEGWEVDDELNLETCFAVCPECVENGEGV